MSAKIQATVTLEEISPERAGELIQVPLGEQRKKREGHITNLAADMLSGRWHISPDAILLVKGKLANGQHRLEAVIRSGRSQKFLILESNDQELFKIVDCGLSRTPGDALMGISYNKLIPSIARWVTGYERNIIAPSDKAPSSSGRGDRYRQIEERKTMTRVELIDYCQTNLGMLQEAASVVQSFYEESHMLAPSIGGAVYVIGHKAGHRDEVTLFLQRVYLGTGQTQHNTVAAEMLRNRLSMNAVSKSKLKPGYIFGITIKALKSYCNGTVPGVLKWVKGESLPVI